MKLADRLQGIAPSATLEITAYANARRDNADNMGPAPMDIGVVGKGTNRIHYIQGRIRFEESTWHQVVGTYDGEVQRLYVDGVLDTEARVTSEAGFSNQLAARFSNGFIPWVIDDIPLSRATNGNRLAGYRNNADADTPSTPSYQYWPGTATAISYNKTALWLHTLERRLGWPVLQRIMSTYFDRWKFRHPKPADFFAVVNEVNGQDMTWFRYRQWLSRS